MQLSELRQRGVNEIAQALKQQHEDSNRSSLDWESVALTAELQRPGN